MTGQLNAKQSEGTECFVEFVRFFPYQTPRIDPGMTGMLLNVPSLGSSEFEVKRGKAYLSRQWATIKDSRHRHKMYSPEFRIVFQKDSTRLEDLANPTKEDNSFYNGLVICGKVSVPVQLQVDAVLEDRHIFNKQENQSIRSAYGLIQACLNSYNDLLDAYRSAHADLWTLSHMCLHETYQLADFRSLSSLIQPSKRLTLPDFVDSSFFRVKCGDWIVGNALLYTSTGSGPPDSSVDQLTQQLLHSRKVTWARYLLDAAQYALDGETGLAVIMANVSIEIAFKELIDAILKNQGIKYKDEHLRKLLEAASFSAQLEILFPLLTDTEIPRDVITRCNELRSARNNLLHWGRGSGSIDRILSLVDAARDVCVRCEELLVEFGVKPSLVRHDPK